MPSNNKIQKTGANHDFLRRGIVPLLILSVRQTQSLEVIAVSAYPASIPTYSQCRACIQVRINRNPTGTGLGKVSASQQGQGAGDGNQKNERLLRNVKLWLAFIAVPA
jgi:hypothetical protein